MDRTVKRPRAEPTLRLNSSLRSHRTQRCSDRYVPSGLNKTLFAPIGPNSVCRGHRHATTADPAGGLGAVEEQRVPSRMKPSRGHQCGGTPTSPCVIPELATVEKEDATCMPPHVGITDSCGLLSGFGVEPGPVGSGRTVGGSEALVGFTIAHHGEEDTKKPSSHGDVRLCFPGCLAQSLDESLTDGLLFGIGLAESNSGIAESPSEGSGTGLGDVAGLGTSGGFLVIRGETGPELDRVGVGKAIEGADLGSDDAAPDLTDAGNRLDQLDGISEPFGAIGEDDAQAQTFTLPFEKSNDLEEVFESVTLGGF